MFRKLLEQSGIRLEIAPAGALASELIEQVNEEQPPVVLPRRSGRPIIAYPSRLSSVVSEAFAFCQGFIVFVDLETRLNLIAADLRRVFNLTAAEARLADCLLREESLKAAAESLRVAAGTARNQLKVIYQKTGTHGQGQLIALIARLATSRRPDTA